MSLGYICGQDCKCKSCRNNNSKLDNSRGDCYICRDCHGGSKKVKECEKYK